MPSLSFLNLVGQFFAVVSDICRLVVGFLGVIVTNVLSICTGLASFEKHSTFINGAKWYITHTRSTLWTRFLTGRQCKTYIHADYIQLQWLITIISLQFSVAPIAPSIGLTLKTTWRSLFCAFLVFLLFYTPYFLSFFLPTNTFIELAKLPLRDCNVTLQNMGFKWSEVWMFLRVEGGAGESRDEEADGSECELEMCAAPLLYSFNDLCAALPPSQWEAAGGERRLSVGTLVVVGIDCTVKEPPNREDSELEHRCRY